MKYSVVLCTLPGFGPSRVSEADVWENPQHVLETIAAAGYDAVDMDAEPDRIPMEKFNGVMKIAESFGLKVSSIIGAWGRGHAGESRDLGSSKPQVRDYAVSYAKKCIDMAADIGSPVYEFVAVPEVGEEYPINEVPLEVAKSNFIACAREIAAYAETKNVPVMIEPINRYEGYMGTLNSVADTMDVIDEIGSAHLGVLCDFFHANIEDTSIMDALLRAGDKLMHIHLSDSNRMAPGTGHIDFHNVVKTLRHMKYQGYLATDCLPHVPDWKTSIQQTIRYMKQIEQMAGMYQPNLDWS